MADLKPMYRGVVGDRTTELMNSFDAAVDTKMTVFDTSIFPPAPNYITVRMANKSCLAMFRYTGISGNQITGLTFEESDIPLGETAKYPIGSFVYWSLANRLLTNIEENIEEIGAATGVQHASKTVYGVVKIGNGINVEDGVISAATGASTFADLQGQPRDNAALAAELDAKQNLLTFDDTPTASSSNPVKSSGILSAINNHIVDSTKISGIIPAANLPVASETQSGMIKVGAGLEMDAEGKLNNKVIAKVTGTTLVFDDGTATVAGKSLII